MLAFECTARAVGSVKEKYKRLLEDFMRNEYEVKFFVYVIVVEIQYMV